VLQQASHGRLGRRDERGSTAGKVIGVVVVLAVIAAVVVFAARRTDDEGGGTDTATGGNEPVRGGTLVIAGAAPNPVLNPATTTNGGSHPQSEPMFNGLLAFDAKNEVVPDLAASLPTVVPEGAGQAATFTLRSGMKWHNGTPIIAEDVEFTFEEALLRYHSRTQASMGPALGVKGGGNSATIPPDAITLPDGPQGLKVTFHFLYPYSPLLKQMNVTEAPIIPKNVYSACSVAVMGAGATLGNQSGSTCAASLAPVGSGPFKWSGATPTEITLVRNESYHKPGLPYLDRVIIQNISNATNALRAARGTSGSADVGTPPANDLASFATPDYATAQVPRGSGGGNCITTLSFNMWAKGMTAAQVLAEPGQYNHRVLRDKAVRKAIYHAFDQDAAFKNIEFSVGRKADSPLHSALEAHDPQPGLPKFDVNQARADLEAAGWKDPSGGTDFTKTRVWAGAARPAVQGIAGSALNPGDPLNLDVIHFDTGSQAAYGIQLKANLLQVGINLTDRPQTNGATQTSMANRDFDMTFVSYCHGDDPVLGVRRQYHSTQIQAVSFTNTSGIREKKASPNDGTMDDLWDRAVPDPSQYKAIQTKAVDVLPMVWMTETINSRVSRKVCTGFNDNNTGLFMETASCIL
jgi:peptide/nickel transport system substrate-binding protein